MSFESLTGVMNGVKQQIDCEVIPREPTKVQGIHVVISHMVDYLLDSPTTRSIGCK